MGQVQRLFAGGTRIYVLPKVRSVGIGLSQLRTVAICAPMALRHAAGTEGREIRGQRNCFADIR